MNTDKYTIGRDAGLTLAIVRGIAKREEKRRNRAAMRQRILGAFKINLFMP